VNEFPSYKNILCSATMFEIFNVTFCDDGCHSGRHEHILFTSVLIFVKILINFKIKVKLLKKI